MSHHPNSLSSLPTTAPGTLSPQSDAVNQLLESVVIEGDLSKLPPTQRVAYYRAVCESVGVNPLTKPFEYIVLNGKLTLYPKVTCTDQIRTNAKMSTEIVKRELLADDVYTVTVHGRLPDGREDEATGSVCLTGLKGEQKANALMKAECVPLDSEILTRTGWKVFDQLTVGEEVLAYDLESDRCRWTPLQNVTIYQEGLVVTFGTQTHAFRCTPDHSWAVATQPYRPRSQQGVRGSYRNRGPARQLVKACNINTGHRVILAAVAEGGPSPLTPIEAAILGWVMCDGTIKRVGNSLRLGISQSKPETVSVIEDLLAACGMEYSTYAGPPTRRIFPSGHTSECLPQHWWYLHAQDSRALFQKAGIQSAADLPSLVTQLSVEARDAMFDAMMMADGSKRGDFGKKRKPGVMDAWQILATMKGLTVGRLSKETRLVRTQRARKSRAMAGANITLSSTATVEPVWCPTTQYGTWVMRQDGMITITGNTKAKRRLTLSLVGLGWLADVEADPRQAPRVDVDYETGELAEPLPVHAQPPEPPKGTAIDHPLTAAGYDTSVVKDIFRWLGQGKPAAQWSAEAKAAGKTLTTRLLQLAHDGLNVAQAADILHRYVAEGPWTADAQNDLLQELEAVRTLDAPLPEELPF